MGQQVSIEQVANGYVVTLPPSAPGSMAVKRSYCPDLSSVQTLLAGHFPALTSDVLNSVATEATAAAKVAPAPTAATAA